MLPEETPQTASYKDVGELDEDNASFTFSFSTFLPSCIHNKHPSGESHNKPLPLLLYNQSTRLDGKPKTEISYLENTLLTSYPHDNNIEESNRLIFQKKPLVSRLYSTNLSSVCASNPELRIVFLNILVGGGAIL